MKEYASDQSRILVADLSSIIVAKYRVFIKYCVSSKIFEYIPDSGLSRCVHWASCLDH